MKLCQWLREPLHDSPPVFAVLFSITGAVTFLAAFWSAIQ